MELSAGDRVRIVGLVQSDCFGRTGTILEVKPSQLFGPRFKRCSVDFQGRIRGILNCHLVRVAEKKKTRSTAA